MHYTVYIIFSISCKKFYTGHTQNFDNRLSEHNNGETKSIKSCIPWTLIWKTELPKRSQAIAFEKKIKSRGAARFLTDLDVKW
ncbi:MAG: GIY-YIG nuclease family protein [Cyclobacteriaceae bacterium]|nr:GIY-YIG nuclease family protein [Cyclobacteriaceae bacterium]